MTNKANVKDTLSRMKNLMAYGLQTESKEAPYSSIEYHKRGADGMEYAIIRENKNFFIKVAPNKPNLVKEDFNYIGGFRNRSDYQYDSFAKAQKDFDLKMMSLKEAANDKNYNVESWDFDKKENVVVEATEKMRNEIRRERQIMANAMRINEAKDCTNDPFCHNVDKEFADQGKANIKGEEHKTGDASASGQSEKVNLKKTDIKEEEVLAWHDSNGNPKDDHYLDKTHGTEIGDSAPFDAAQGKQIDGSGDSNPSTGDEKNGVVAEGESMHDQDNQNTPSVGVGEGPSDEHNKPFDGEEGKQIDEAVDDIEVDDTADGEDVDVDVDDTADGEDFEVDADDTFDADDDTFDADDEDGEEIDDAEGDEVLDRLDYLEDMIAKIADALEIDEPTLDDEDYDGDDDLFDDSTDDEDGYELEYDDDDVNDDDYADDDDYDEMPMESRKRRGTRIVETANYKRAMRRMMNEEGMKPFSDAGRVPANNMNRLNDFGKHPAYQKKVMNLPPKDFQEFDGYYDMNDESVHNDSPYGERIGDGAPFEINPDTIANAIAESLIRLKKK